MQTWLKPYGLPLLGLKGAVRPLSELAPGAYVYRTAFVGPPVMMIDVITWPGSSVANDRVPLSVNVIDPWNPS